MNSNKGAIKSLMMIITIIIMGITSWYLLPVFKKNLETSKKHSMIQTATSYINTVRNNWNQGNFECYNNNNYLFSNELNNGEYYILINEKLENFPKVNIVDEKTLISPISKKEYKGYVKVTFDNINPNFSILLQDKNYEIDSKEEDLSQINPENLKLKRYIPIKYNELNWNYCRSVK